MMQTIQDNEFVNIVKGLEKSLLHSKNVIADVVKSLKALNVYGKKKGSLLRSKVDEDVVLHWYTRLAAAITQAAMQKEEISIGEMVELARVKAEIVYVFSASGYGSTNHLMHLCSKSAYGTTAEYDRPKLLHMLSLISIDDLPPEFLEVANKLPKPQFFILSLGWLCERAILTPQGEANRTRLIENSGVFNEITIDKHSIPLIAKVWMYCSYADTPKKNVIKLALNGILRRYMVGQNVIPKVKDRTIRDRPTILVIHEYFTSKHAMFRCYAPMIRELQTDFDLIAMAQSNQIDDSSSDMFSYIKTDNFDGMEISKIVDVVNKLKPDLIYYPSVGMRIWVIMLANLRLAPIQIASLGHPATTYSNEIDYIFAGQQEGNVEEIYTEKVLRTPFFLEHDSHPEQEDYLGGERTVKHSESDGLTHIAINSKVMKLSSRLLAICKKLNEEFPGLLKFHIFPGEIGIYDDGVSSKIKSILPNSIIYPAMNYVIFLGNLDRCNLALAAFPFGNTNSTVDVHLLGLPIVAHYGPEMPAQTDKLVLKSFGYSGRQINTSDREYFESAVLCIQNIRSKSYDHSSYDIKARPDLDKGKGPNYFGDIVKQVYLTHEEIISKEIQSIYWEPSNLPSKAGM
ncbi:hypothetical protein N9D35_05330 [Gammaproteobacteria bacterium]|nr:hypothetical protein [Gammaproteobacteria bacterium]